MRPVAVMPCTDWMNKNVYFKVNNDNKKKQNNITTQINYSLFSVWNNKEMLTFADIVFNRLTTTVNINNHLSRRKDRSNNLNSDFVE